MSGSLNKWFPVRLCAPAVPCNSSLGAAKGWRGGWVRGSLGGQSINWRVPSHSDTHPPFGEKWEQQKTNKKIDSTKCINCDWIVQILKVQRVKQNNKRIDQNKLYLTDME